MNANPTVYNWAECVDDVTAIAKRLLDRIPDVHDRAAAHIAAARIIHDQRPKPSSQSTSRMPAVETPVIRKKDDYR